MPLPPLGSGAVAELVRRSLLVLSTALIVARPLVSGEDPGLLSDRTDASGLFLTLLTFLTALAWGVWRVLAGRTAWHGGLVEAGLVLVVACVFVAAEFAPYKHPARLIGWEWVGLLLLLIVVRQVAVAADDQRRLVAVLLATAVAVSANAGYQLAIDLPYQQHQTPTEAVFRQANYLSEDNPEGDAQWQRLQEGRATATFTHPETLAGYLALALPVLGGALLAGRRAGASRTLVGALLVALLMTAVALFMTRTAAAVLAVALVALGAAGLAWWRRSGAWFLWLASAVLLLTALGMQMSSGTVPGLGALVTAWSEPWQPTVALLESRGYFGLGPGQFAAAYLRVMPVSAAVEATQPNNLFLETWAMAGPCAVLGLVLALGAFFVRMARAPDAPILDKTPMPTGMAPLRAELYLGGMLGLLLSFVLRAGNGLDQTEIVAQAWPAGVRCVVWFAAYALFERVGWTDRVRGLALTAGVAAVVLTLLVSGGIGYPALTASLWVAVGLALNTQGPPPEGETRWRLLSQWLPLPVLLGVTALFAILVFYPVASASSTASSAQAAGRATLSGIVAKPEPNKPQAPPPTVDSALLLKTVFPLREASDADPTDARWHVRLAFWEGRLAAANPTFRYRAPSANESGQPLTNGLFQARRAQELDPDGRPGYWAQYELTLFQARQWEIVALNAKLQLARKPRPEDLLGFAANPLVRWCGWEDRLRREETTLRAVRSRIRPQIESARKAYGEAGQVLEHALEHDPNNARLAGLRAEALMFQYGLHPDAINAEYLGTRFDDKTPFWEIIQQDMVRQRQARAAVEPAARKALDLDALTPRGPRGLTDRQRAALESLFQPPSPP